MERGYTATSCTEGNKKLVCEYINSKIVKKLVVRAGLHSTNSAMQSFFAGVASQKYLEHHVTLGSHTTHTTNKATKGLYLNLSVVSLPDHDHLKEQKTI